jgi:hypothetical protein
MKLLRKLLTWVSDEWRARMMTPCPICVNRARFAGRAYGDIYERYHGRGHE